MTGPSGSDGGMAEMREPKPDRNWAIQAVARPPWGRRDHGLMLPIDPVVRAQLWMGLRQGLLAGTAALPTGPGGSPAPARSSGEHAVIDRRVDLGGARPSADVRRLAAWIDHEAAVSMHRVRPGEPAERRLARLASPSQCDDRISYGCINLPSAFFDEHFWPNVGTGMSIVHVLPETRPLAAAFPALAAREPDA